MRRLKLSFIFSVILILVNLVFLYGVVSYKSWVSTLIVPGLTIGILGVGLVITFAVALTWVYVHYINKHTSN